MRIAQIFPLLAKQADKFSILRSFTSLTDDHYGGTYTVQTGFPTSQQFGARMRPSNSATRPLARSWA